VINAIFVGQLNDPAKLAGVGMANMTLNLLAFSPLMGMNSVLETLVSQAFGSGNLYMCGVYLNRGRFLTTCFFIPVMFVLLNTDHILIAMGQDIEVAGYAQEYITTLFPGIYLQI
jgi:Na+-driven multidrug efflux pump